MKIGKGLLKQVEKDSIGTDELYSESTYRHIGQLYRNALIRHAKKDRWFLAPQISEAKRKKRYEQIKKFIDMCLEFEIPYDVVMDHQVKILVKFIKEKNIPIKYPPFNMLISENARKRLEGIKRDIIKRYTGRARVKESFSVQFLDIEKSLRSSIRKVYDQFMRTKDFIGAIQGFEAAQDLEIMARAKLISNVYVYSSPLGEETEFLKQIKEDAGKRLSRQQKEEVVRIKKDLMSEFKDKEVLKYV